MYIFYKLFKKERYAKDLELKIDLRKNSFDGMAFCGVLKFRNFDIFEGQKSDFWKVIISTDVKHRLSFKCYFLPLF